MAKIAYVAYNEIMDAIFTALHVNISTDDFGGVTGWYESQYQQALSDAWDALLALDEIDIDEIEGSDDWDAIEALIHGNYAVSYWSTDSGHMPS